MINTKKKKVIDEEEIKNNLIKKLTEETNLLRNQNTELRHMAEKSGSDMAKWKHLAIRLEEKIKKLNI